MNALAIALQGVGYPVLVTALQGLVEFAQEESGGGGTELPRPAESPRRRIVRRAVETDETTETRPQEAPAAAVGTQTPEAPRTRPVEADSGPRGTSAQMLRAELAQIQTQAREREAKFAAERERLSAQAEAAQAAALLAARKRDNNRRAQILIALLMLD
jgi:hypothetical protein